MAAALILALAAASPAAAITRYVDDTVPGGNDDPLNDCTNPSGPCRTIPFALGKAVANDTVLVGGGSYSASITLADGKSLVGSDFFGAHTDGAPVIDNGAAGQAAITVTSGSPTRIEGLTVRSNFQAIDVYAPATITGNTFDDPTPSTAPAPLNANVVIEVGAGSPMVANNSFTDPAPNDDQFALFSHSTGSPEISENHFTGFLQSIRAGIGSAQILRNDVAGTHAASSAGAGIIITSGSPTIAGNALHDPAAAGTTAGVSLLGIGPTSATFRHNRILGYQTGLKVDETTSPTTLDGDVIANSTLLGIASDDGPGDDGLGNVVARNVTMSGNASHDVLLDNTHLTLDSSIVGEGGIDVTGSASCVIAFSRGPVGGSGPCGTFQTNADPGFVDAAANDFHLLASSALLDIGDPAAPPTGATDPDGDARALDANGDCVARRDIGADEFKPASTPNCPGPPQDSQQQAGGATLKAMLAINGFSMTNRVFRAGGRGRAAGRRGRRAPKGTAFRFTLSTAARLTFTVERRATGRRVGRSCRPPARRNRGRKRCIRYVRVHTFPGIGTAGANRVPFSGRLQVRGRARGLPPGRYRAWLTAKDAGGSRSESRKITFRIVK